MPLLEFGHVDPDEMLLGIEQEFGERLAELRLADTVGPRNRNDPYGRFGSDRPERERRIASATSRTASSWPTTRRCSASSMCSSLSRSPCIIFDTGMPVARETTSAISSAPTSVRRSCAFFGDFASFVSALLSWASSCGSWPYCSSDIFCQSPLRRASSICSLILSISSLMCCVPTTFDFSACQTSFRSEYSRSSFAISCSISDRRFSTPRRFLLHRFALDLQLNDAAVEPVHRLGFESISMRMRAAASSIRSIALSGRKRSVM
jgi:hypothetical protein